MAGLAIAAQVIFVFFASLSGAWAQGDFAPYEKPDKLKKIIKAPADPKKKKSNAKRVARRNNSQVARVVIDGSAVYEAPNFDAPVMEYLDRDKKIVISKKLYQGIGGLGAFYKVRLRKGAYGYITDVDITLSKGKKEAEDDDGQGDDAELENDPTRISNDLFDGSRPNDLGTSIYLSRFLGFGYYQFNYTERIAGRDESAATPMFGIKFSGPTGFMGGMPMDIDILMTSDAPEFYEDFTTKTAGMMVMTSLAAMIPMAEYSWLLLYYGIGPVIRYSKWDVTLKTNPDKKPVDSQEVGAGAVGTIGVVIKIGKSIAIRADGKYIYEKEKYFGVGGGLQMNF